MLELQYEQDGNILKNVHVTRNGTKVGTVVSIFPTLFEWSPAVSTDVEAEAVLKSVGDFVFIISNNSPLYAQIVLCFFEENPTYKMGDRSDSAKIWPVKPVYHAPGVFWKQKLEHHIDVVKMSFNGAVYLPVNPGTISLSFLDKAEYADKTSKGRWLFPHPEGSRSAYEHMQKTTLEDDYQRFLPHFDEHPELMETFSDL